MDNLEKLETNGSVVDFAETLHLEVESFGIQVLDIEPGYFRTALLSDANIATGSSSAAIPEYAELTKVFKALVAGANGKQPGNAERGVKVILDIIEEIRKPKGEGRKVPVRFPLGSDSYAYVEYRSKAALNTLKEWEQVIMSTDHDDVVTKPTPAQSGLLM
jgi:hypothetical protein